MYINTLNTLNVKAIETLDVEEATKHRIATFAISKGWRPYANDEKDFHVSHEEVIANLLLEQEFRTDAVEYVRQLFKYGSHHLPELAKRLQDAILRAWKEEKEVVSLQHAVENEDEALTAFIQRHGEEVASISGSCNTIASHGNLLCLAEDGSDHNIVMDEAGGVLLSANRGGNLIRACGFGNLYIIGSENDTILVDGASTTVITGNSATVKVVDGRSATYLTGKDVDVIVNIENPVEGIDNGVIIATEGFGVINIKSPIPRLEVNDRYDVFFEGNRVNLPDGASYYILNYNYDAGKYQVEVIY